MPLIMIWLKKNNQSLFNNICAFNVAGFVLNPATITTKSGNPYVAVLISWFLVQVRFIWFKSIKCTVFVHLEIHVYSYSVFYIDLNFLYCICLKYISVYINAFWIQSLFLASFNTLLYVSFICILKKNQLRTVLQ